MTARSNLPSANYLKETISKLENAIAFNVSCPQMLAYQCAKLARAQALLSA